MKPAARREMIVQLVQELGEVHVDELSDKFDTSRETIRRDLNELDATGRIRKFHGGARKTSGIAETGLTEGPFDARMATFTAEKTAIGRRAAELFEEGAVIFVDTGSTTIAFARALARRRGLTVITNSPEIAGLLARPEGHHRLYLLGGEIAAEGRETLGALAIEQLHQFKAEHVVLTIGGMTRNEIMDYDLRETELARAMLGRAARVTVLADHSKLDRAAVFEVAPLSAIDRLVTDRMPSEAMVTALADAGVELVIAEPV
ncbi:MAG: DeoR/GlpR family DNA-binding transcription regulator [Salipiger thiooxidans]|uniref:Transcriptional regulator, DeoR family n=1 Tax=Salipiger thiooxidans TaxID=282683 RepID=A0A1G7BMP7_9RHOB|nr:MULTISPECIES: DeoR/GlpR family DNA-binding transcription regulator [Salipiger]MAU46419.1 DeoR/GlpR transcriptional regulator [Salipiger sp.]MBR9837929.1 DeoR/GlpR transcriptional regulator [Paracoccaceae bacterium]MBN8187264.1 DeoR/GlpR transcriptional regulator [Salipiger thiooxidans]MCA0847412.1 DeoR/GlpR family DNA-binding transcription regulator [Salipiger thiooxidans]NIY98474.1 DeoR/GlpR transcriptional regulator [Salipiger sp. HF18]